MSIKLKIEESKTYEDVEITITCPEVDERLSKLIRHIRQSMYYFTVKKGQTVYTVDSDDVLYIETVDNTTFLYTNEDVYESELKLYEFEQQLKDTGFLRISKHLIVNTGKVDSVRALLNGRFEAMLENGEKVIVNRHYAKNFRKYILG